MIIFFDLARELSYWVLVQKHVFFGVQAFMKLYFTFDKMKTCYFENINTLVCQPPNLRKKIYLRTSGT